MQADLEALQSTALFEDMPPEHLAQLAMCVKHRRFDRGQTIFNFGDPGNALMIVDSGEVEISFETPTGEHITLALLGPGETFGELALTDGKERSASAIAAVPTDLMVLYRDDFLNVFRSEPMVAQAVLNSLTGIIRRTNEKLADVAMLDVHGRMAKAFQQLEDRHGVEAEEGIKIDRPVTVDDIAGLTSLYPVEVARLMRDYEYENIIYLKDDELTLLKPDLIRSWASTRRR